MNMNRTVVGILKKDGKVLIVKRKKDDGSTWAFPGGKLKMVNLFMMRSSERYARNAA